MISAERENPVSRNSKTKACENGGKIQFKNSIQD